MLIEAAEFAPLSIRTTARKLKLHSASSYRFERGVDPEGVDWASRRCCELILELAGGELAEGVIDVGPPPPARAADHAAARRSSSGFWASTCRPKRCGKILTALGCREQAADDATQVDHAFRPVGGAIWRARSTWSKKSPAFTATTRFPKTSACRWPRRTGPTSDRVLAKVRQVLTAAGFDEAMTASVVPERWSRGVQPLDRPPSRWWPTRRCWEGPIACGGASCRACSTRGGSTNRSAIQSIELFEMARIYLPQPRRVCRASS